MEGEERQGVDGMWQKERDLRVIGMEGYIIMMKLKTKYSGRNKREDKVRKRIL